MSRLVARGSIRVDARRAVQKLREHLLVDLNLYLIELVRAAAAGGAKHIDVRWDADDVLLSFDGDPVPPQALVRLLDHVLDAAPSPEARRLRLLAIGVNAALGLRPSRVEVLTSTRDAGGEVRCARVRFAPAMLDAAEGAPSPALDDVPLPPGMLASGMQIAVRRRLGWSVLRRAISGGRPPEVEQLVGATADLPIPLTVGGSPLPRDDHGAALVRVAFHVRGTRRAMLEIVAPGPFPSGLPVVDFLEHGVRLLRESYSFAPRFPAAPREGVELPVRIVVDADELPTNASRSALREDAPLRASLRDGAAAALEGALRALAAAACGTGEVPEDVAVLSDDRDRLEDALGAIACVAAGAAREGAMLAPELQAVRAAPLFRDGRGRPVSLASLEARGDALLHVWRGDAPLPEELAPWDGDVVWLRGRLAERALTALPLADAAVLVDRARHGAGRRRAFFARAPGEPAVAPSPDHALRAGFHVEEGPCAGLRGEAAVFADEGAARRRGAVRVFVQGRHLETVELDPAAVPLPVEIALTWDGRVRPTVSYDGVARDRAFWQAVWYALRVVILAADAEARREDLPEQELARLRYPLRAAIGTLVCAPMARGEPGPSEAAGLSDEGRDTAFAGLSDEGRDTAFAGLSDEGRDTAFAGLSDEGRDTAFAGLSDAPVWPTTEPRRFVSLSQLATAGTLRRSICFAPPNAQGRAADHRPVLAVSQRELDWLAAALPGRTLVPYAHAIYEEQALAERSEARRRALAASLARLVGPPADGTPVLELQRRTTLALAAPSETAVVAWHHAAEPLVTLKREPHLGPLAIAIDDDEAEPNADWSDLLAPRDDTALREVERALCEALVAALEGDPTAAARLGLPSEGVRPNPRVTAYLLRAARVLGSARGGAPLAQGARDLAARIRLLPLLTVLDERGEPVPCSLDAIVAAHPDGRAIPLLDAVPGFETLGWHPVVVRDEHERASFAWWSHGRAVMATAELPDRRQRAAIERERRAFFAAPELDPHALGDLADAAPRAVFLPPEARTGISVAAALPRAGAESAHAWADVLFCKRALRRRAFPELRTPVVARVDVTDLSDIEGIRDLSPSGAERVTRRVHEAATALAHDLLTSAGDGARHGEVFGDPRALALLAALVALGDQATNAPAAWREQSVVLTATLRSGAVRWPTVQGDAQPLDKVQRLGKALCTATRVFVPWRAAERRTQLDEPVLLVPQGAVGDGMRAVLAALGIPLRDVTAELAALQERRAGDAPAEAPQLPGAPAHPLLRLSLASHGMHDAAGEIEIVEGPASDVCFIGLDGAPARVAAELPIPLRVLARVDAVAPSGPVAHAFLTKIAKVAGRHLISLAPRFDELPPYVRSHMRRAVCKTLADGKRVATKAASAMLFEDIHGALYALDDLRRNLDVEWLCTHGPPPYPARRYAAPVLRLSEVERRDLATAVLIKNITAVVTRDRAGEERAAAPPLDAVTLDEESRAKCFEVIRIEAESEGAEGLWGEIGLLAPEHAGAAGITAHVGRRRLCVIEVDAGWPLCAAVNDDDVPPNRYFDGIRTSAAASKLRQRVRAVAARWLRARVAAPSDALATRWIDGVYGEDRSLLLTGVLWLPSRWPREPRVLVSTPGPRGSDAALAGAPLLRALSVDARGAGSPSAALRPKRQADVSGSGHLRGLVPVEGALLISPRNGRWDEVAEIVLEAATSMLADIAGARRDDPALAPYLWNLSLLGRIDAGALSSPTAAGNGVSAQEILAELGARGRLWLTDRRGAVEGAFPRDTPAFVLVDDGSPLIEVLRHRAGPGVLFELGGLAAAAPPDAATRVDDASASDPADRPSRHGAALAELRRDPSARFSWVGELWRSVQLLLAGRRAEELVPAVGTSPLAEGLFALVQQIDLYGDPIRAVVEGRSGRPVRYDPSTRSIVVNPQHASLAWLRASGPPDPEALALLAAAAVGEVHRTITSFTDAEERRALNQLLRALAGGDRGRGPRGASKPRM